MTFFAAAFALVLSVLLWGLGFAWLATPRRWRMLWPLFIAPCGVALQMGVVWVGVHTPLAGTDAYAPAAWSVPLLLLALAVWRGGRAGWTSLRRYSGVAAVMLATLLLLADAMSSASRRLTSFSLGSCDAADYAAGARVLKEFAASDRGGFLGLTEVVRIMSVDNFVDYWIRLNHFAPSALAALSGSLLGYEPYQIISLLGGVLLVLGVPMAFLMARSALRMRQAGALAVAGVYGFSPLLWYAVAHVALSQLVAAIALALITWSGVMLWRGTVGWRRAVMFAPLLATGYALVLGAYNFMIVFCLLPVAAYAVGWTIWSGRYARILRWFAAMAAPLALAAALMPERVAGLVERFLLLRQYDFGWRIPALSPEGWMGMVGGVLLQGYAPWVRWTLSVFVVLAFLLAVVAAFRRRRDTGFLALCLTVPVLAGYVILLLQARSQGTNASYDAYKLLAAFYPVVLPGLGLALATLTPKVSLRSGLLAVFALGLLGANVVGSWRFAERLRNPPYLVDRGLAALQLVEQRPEVTSINLRINDFWMRFWAHSFLLRKPHYFPSHTYEARLNTELRGEWDLIGGLITITLPPGEVPVPPERPFSLIPQQSDFAIRARIGEGWYEREQIPRANTRWRWTTGDAELVIDNLQSRPLDIGFRFQARSLVSRELEVWVDGRRRRTAQIGTDLAWIEVPSVRIAPGTTTVELRSPTAPTFAGPNDRRPLGFAAYGIEVKVLRDPDPGGE